MALVLNGNGTITGGNLNIDSDGSASFTSLTVDTSTLHVDATNNRVGIGTSSPAHKLTVAGYSNVDSTNKLAIGDNAGYQALIHMESATETLTIENTSDYPGRATIFKDNGTERMRIDAGGRVTMPFQPAFVAYSGTDTIHTTTGTFPLEIAALNIGNHYNTSTYTFTAPVAGTYKFVISALLASGGHMVLRRNGAYAVGGGGASGIHQVGASYAQCCKEFIITLSANDTITAHQDNGNGIYRSWVLMTGCLLS